MEEILDLADFFYNTSAANTKNITVSSVRKRASNKSVSIRDVQKYILFTKSADNRHNNKTPKFVDLW